MKRKLLILPPIAIGIAVLAFFITQREPPERKPLSERATPVRAIVVTESEIIPRVIGYGTVQPSKVWDILHFADAFDRKQAYLTVPCTRGMGISVNAEVSADFDGLHRLLALALQPAGINRNHPCLHDRV